MCYQHFVSIIGGKGELSDATKDEMVNSLQNGASSIQTLPGSSRNREEIKESNKNSTTSSQPTTQPSASLSGGDKNKGMEIYSLVNRKVYIASVNL